MCSLCTFCGHDRAHACNAWLVDCCCLSVVLSKLVFFHLSTFDRFGLGLHAICTFCVHVDAHACSALFVDCCCVSVVCQRLQFHLRLYDMLVMELSARWVHSVGMWMHMFAKLGWCVVVACRWLVKACFLVCAYLIELGWNCMQVVYMLLACGCTCLQSLVCGLLLLVCGLSKLALSFVCR